jgi:hypothetical protein
LHVFFYKIDLLIKKTLWGNVCRKLEKNLY